MTSHNQIVFGLGTLVSQLSPNLAEAACFGAFTILVAVSTVVIVRGGAFLSRRVVMLGSVWAMYMCAILHLSSSLDQMLSFAQDLLDLTSCLLAWADPELPLAPTSCPPLKASFRPRLSLGSIMPHAMLTLSILIGDTIILWRAWLLWPRNFCVRAVSCFLLASSAALAIAHIAVFTEGIHHIYEESPMPPEAISAPFENGRISRNADMTRQQFIGGAAIIVTTFISLFATSLIAYKAWHHRRLIRESLQHGARRTRVEKVLILLVESGVVYSIFWVALLIAVGAEWYLSVPPNRGNVAMTKYYDAVTKFTQGSLIQIVGMYPTLIILLVALQEPHTFHHVTRQLPEVPIAPVIPLRHITVTEAEGDARGDEESAAAGISVGLRDNSQSATYILTIGADIVEMSSLDELYKYLAGQDIEDRRSTSQPVEPI